MNDADDNSKIYEEVNFTINSQNMNRFQNNISSDASIQLSVSFQKENFMIHKTNDYFDLQKLEFERQYGARKDEMLIKQETNRRRITQLLEERKNRKIELENGIIPYNT